MAQTTSAVYGWIRESRRFFRRRFTETCPVPIVSAALALVLGATVLVALPVPASADMASSVPKITQQGMIIEADNSSSGPDGNTQLSVGGASVAALALRNSVTVRAQITNSGGATSTAKSLGLFYDRGDGQWARVKSSGTVNAAAGNCVDSGFNCTTIDNGGYVGQDSSIVVDSTGSPWIAEYNATAGALRVAHYVGAGGTGCATSAWSCTNVISGDLGRSTSIGLDATGRPWVSYYDIGNGDLRYANYVGSGGTGCAVSTWSCKGIDFGSDTGLETSLAFDSSNNAWIAYYDTNNGNLRLARYVSNGGTGCSSANWTCVTVDQSGDVGRNPSLAFDLNGTAWLSETDVTNGNLKVAKFVGTGGSGCLSTAWNCTVVESTNYVGEYSSLAIDPLGNPWVSHFDASGGNLRVARYVGSGGSGCASSAWTCTAVDTASETGKWTDIAFDPSGAARVAYYDNITEDLRMARYVGTGGVGCASTAWTCTTVDSTGDVGPDPALAFDEDGNFWISYLDVTNGDLKVAKSARSGELRFASSSVANQGDAITESHVDMTSTSNAANRDDADCLASGASWTNGKWFEQDAPTGISLGSNQCTEVAFVLDTTDATVGSTYRFVVATDDGPRPDQGLWRGPVGFGSTAKPGVTIDYPVPSAAFATTPTSGTAPVNVSFDASGSTAYAGATINGYSWNFGDGQTATGKTTSHVFASGGTYAATLTVTDSRGRNATTTQNLVILSPIPPDANFTMTMLHGPTPRGVTFNAASSSPGSGEITNYSWVYGDGQTATGMIVDHVYAASGTYNATLTVTNSAGITNSESHSVTVIGGPTARLSATPTTGTAPLIVNFDASASSGESPATITSYEWNFGDGVSTNSVNGSVTHVYADAETYAPTVTVTDNNTNTSFATASIVVDGAPEGPPPELQPPTVDPQESTSMSDRLGFLFDGANPVQTGVDKSKISDERVALIRGRVVDDAGNAIANTVVRVQDRPEFGQTRTRSDGNYDLAVNGGGTLVVSFDAEGYLPVQRQQEIAWNDATLLDDVVLMKVDSASTPVNLDTVPTNDFAVAKSSTVSDQDGARQSTLLVPSGTSAELVMQDGSRQPIDQLTMRATEYTVGDNGQEAMPAELPPQSAYTYAVELSADEAIAAGADTVEFDKPLYNYVDNFIGFPVGTAVPAAYYDEDKAAWIPSPNGVVIKILSVTSGMVDVDVTGDGLADAGATLSDLGFTDAERTKLATLYSPGKQVWRVPVTHFTPWDYNWPFGLPDGAVGPNGELLGGINGNPNCRAPGSIINCQSQSIEEVVPVANTPLALHYSSERVSGRTVERTISVPVTGASVPDGLKRVEVGFCVVGNCQKRTFNNAPTQSTSFEWDGKDAFGRPVATRQDADVEVKFIYGAVYRAPAQFESSFGAVGNQVIAGNRAASEIEVSSKQSMSVEATTTNVTDLAGWNVEGHHRLDPQRQELYMSDGRVLSTGPVIDTVAGNGVAVEGGENPDKHIAEGQNPLTTPLGYIDSLAVAADGSTYFHNQANIYRQDGEGIHRIAGDDTSASWTHPSNPTSDVPADGVATGGVSDIAIDPLTDELYFGSGCSIRKIDKAGFVRDVAGAWHFCRSSGDGQRIVEPLEINVNEEVPYLGEVKYIAFDSQGDLYVATNISLNGYGEVIRRIGVDGIVTTVAGNGDYTSVLTGDGELATDVPLGVIGGLAVDKSGDVLFSALSVIRKVGRDGTVQTIAGGGQTPASQGGPARELNLSPGRLLAASDGNLYFANYQSAPFSQEFGWQAWPQIEVLRDGGSIERLAGVVRPDSLTYNDHVASGDELGDRGPASAGIFGEVNGLAFRGSDLLTSDAAFGRIRQILSSVRASGTDVAIPSPDGKEIYVFDANGRHLETREALTNAVVDTFGYDANGDLISVADGDGNTTTFTRNGSNITVTGPYGGVSTLSVGTGGYLSSVTDATSSHYDFGYATGGLLNSFRDARGAMSTMTYDNTGRLTQENKPNGGLTKLSRTSTGKASTVTQETAEGRKTIYGTEPLPDGRIKQTITDPSGAVTTTYFGLDGVITTSDPTGMTSTVKGGPDPRWGIRAPLVNSVTMKSPAGVDTNTTISRSVTLANQGDPLSLTSQTDTTTINGKTSSVAYDRASNTLTEKTPLGRQTVTRLDPHGRTSVSQRDGMPPTSYTYDAHGRVTTVTTGLGPVAHTSTITYGPDGYTATMTDPLGRVTTFNTRDAVGRAGSVTGPGNLTTDMQYSSSGDLTGITPPGGTEHNFEYDERGLLTESHGPGGSEWSYNYDSDGATTNVDRPGSVDIANSYDAGGRLSTVNLGGVSNTYGYDNLSRLTSLATSDGQNLTFGYDGNLPIAETLSGPFNSSMNRSFDGFRRVTSDSVNGETSVPYSYDDDGLLVGAGPLSVERNVQSGVLSSTSVGGVADTVTYDQYAQVDTYTAEFGTTILYAVDVDHDANGRVTSAVETVGTTTTGYGYTYDPAGRLATVSVDGNLAVTYSYDDAGNRISRIAGSTIESTATNDRNQVTSDGASTYTYLPSGERATKTTGATSTSYSYDAAGTLRGVVLPNGDHIDYVIDGQGRRVGKKINGTLNEGFVYDGSAVAATVDPSGNTVERFIYGTGGNTPDLIQKSGVTYRVIADSRGSVRAIVDTTNGNAVQRLDYDEFGRVTTDTNPGFQPFGYAGGLYDRDTGLVHFGAREYDPQTGTWTSEDPLGFQSGDPNFYSYASNDPINNVDPTGLFWESGLDAGFIAYDTVDLIRAARMGCNTRTQKIALALDLAGLFTPGGTGFGLAYRVGSKARAFEKLDEANHLAKRVDTPPRACPISSFVPGTEVLMADGTTKDIEDVEVGDLVLSTDPETGETKAKPVTKLINSEGQKTLVDITVDGNVITSTDRHPFWDETTNTWTDAQDLQVGDRLQESNGTTTSVDAKVNYVNADQRVHNLSVADFHTYYVVDGNLSLLVHNSGCMLGASGPQVMSKTVLPARSGHNYRIDVENPAPGKRPGQLHVQRGDEKYLYDFEEEAWIGIPPSFAKELAKDPEVIAAINRGKQYLGIGGAP